ncbi:Hypothetical predicted protein [Cloeon dipterum]|uniref:Uncharacterized protein n=1 Tax=Cloeon dipterum TaxID=197152 RepID=A0A8S1CVY3_9INSE|nr:Hypothetical predicted protein [Cloeon dipterum]
MCVAELDGSGGAIGGINLPYSQAGGARGREESIEMRAARWVRPVAETLLVTFGVSVQTKAARRVRRCAAKERGCGAAPLTVSPAAVAAAIAAASVRPGTSPASAQRNSPG